MLEVLNLTVDLNTGKGGFRPVDDVSFDVQSGEIVGLVGESGSGKTLTALSLTKLLASPQGFMTSGHVLLDGVDVLDVDDRSLRDIRGRRMSMVFQDPMTTLNPLLSVGVQIAEALEIHTESNAKSARQRAIDLLDAVGIPGAAARIDDYPHEFSGGMRQRVCIAMALACSPQLIIADEITTALDVTIQAQVLDLLQGISQDTGMSVLMITHDLGIIAGLANRVNVMYAGQIVEQAPTRDLFKAPLMPYTAGLLRSIPRVEARADEPLTPIQGRPPSPFHLPSGCRFHPRCPYAREICRLQEPRLLPVPGVQSRQATRCWGTQDVDGGGWLIGRNLLHVEVRGDAVTLRTARTPSNPVPVSVTDRGSASSGSSSQPPKGSAEDPRPLVEVHDLQIEFPISSGLFSRAKRTVRAVDGVSFAIPRGQTLSLVGESGCWKTTTGRGILRLADTSGGSVFFDGIDLTQLRGAELRAMRRRIQVVLQDPYSSLDRRMTIGNIIGEPLKVHGTVPRSEIDGIVQELMDRVGLDPRSTGRYPHEFSGGQRQRVAIARALALTPDFIVADEPLSALDVSVQAQIVNLLEELQADMNLTYLFIAHDLAVVRHISDIVAVMYLGRILEIAPSESLFGSPIHPYTQSLLAAVPIPDPEAKSNRNRIILQGEVPDPADPPIGCRFSSRCGLRLQLGSPEQCTTVEPILVESRSEHWSACHFTGRASNGGQSAGQQARSDWINSPTSPLLQPSTEQGAASSQTTSDDSDSRGSPSAQWQGPWSGNPGVS